MDVKRTQSLSDEPDSEPAIERGLEDLSCSALGGVILILILFLGQMAATLGLTTARSENGVVAKGEITLRVRNWAHFLDISEIVVSCDETEIERYSNQVSSNHELPSDQAPTTSYYYLPGTLNHTIDLSFTDRNKRIIAFPFSSINRLSPKINFEFEIPPTSRSITVVLNRKRRRSDKADKILGDLVGNDPLRFPSLDKWNAPALLVELAVEPLGLREFVQTKFSMPKEPETYTNGLAPFKNNLHIFCSESSSAYRCKFDDETSCYLVSVPIEELIGSAEQQIGSESVSLHLALGE